MWNSIHWLVWMVNHNTSNVTVHSLQYQQNCYFLKIPQMAVIIHSSVAQRAHQWQHCTEWQPCCHLVVVSVMKVVECSWNITNERIIVISCISQERQCYLLVMWVIYFQQKSYYKLYWEFRIIWQVWHLMPCSRILHLGTMTAWKITWIKRYLFFIN